MSQSIQGHVLRVEKKDNRTGDGHHYKVAFSDGTNEKEWVTFETDIAELAFSLVGKPATLVGEVVKRGRFWNYDLENLIPGAGGAPNVSPVVQQQASQIPTAGAGPALPREVEKETRIVRGNAVNATAALLSGSPVTLEEFVEFADGVARFIVRGLGEPGTVTAPLTTQGVVEQVNQVVPGAVQVGAPTPEHDGIPY